MSEAELAPPPELYEAFVDNDDEPAFRDIVGWELHEGIWFLRRSDRSVVALGLIHHPCIEIRPQRPS